MSSAATVERVDEFAELVRRCRKDNSSRLIHNLFWDHAIVLIKELLLSAADEHEPVRLISHSLTTKFYNNHDLLDALDRALESTKVKLIVTDTEANQDENRFASAVQDSRNGDMKIVALDLPQETSPHFLVVGENKFRYVENPSEYKAVASFNNESMGSFLARLFDSIWQQEKLEFGDVKWEKLQVT